MPFVVEDGTGLADANSYVSLAEANAYFSLRPANAVWSGKADELMQAALTDASDFVDDQFGGRFKGVQASATQALAWPRDVQPAPVHFGEVYGVTADFPVGIVPRQIKRAVCELAAFSIAGTDLYGQRAPATVITQSVDTIGPIVKSRSYAVQGAQPSGFTVYADKVSSILAPLLDNSSILNLPTGR